MQWNLEYGLNHSGTNQTFQTGATREVKAGKGRFDLISPRFLRRLAVVLERGAKNHGDRNWEKGIPLHSFLDSALRHISRILLGDQSEDHAAQAAWNLHALIHTAELIAEGKLPRELDDIGYVPAPEVVKVDLKPEFLRWLEYGPKGIQDTFAEFERRGWSEQEIQTAREELTEAGKVEISDFNGMDFTYKLTENKTSE